MKVAVALAERFGCQIRIVEPHVQALPQVFAGTRATLIDIDEAIEECPVMVLLVDHDIFRSVPLEECAGKTVLDTRGIWAEQPRSPFPGTSLRLAS